MSEQSGEKVALTSAERAMLDERVAGDWWGYYIHFEPTGVPEVDRVLSAIGLAGKMYHHTDLWNEDDADYGPIRKGESPVEFIQRAANDAALRLPPAYTEHIGRQAQRRCVVIRPETSIAEACANLDPCVALAALVKALNEAADELEFEHHDAYHAQQLRKLAAIGTQP